jgi:hypothetical protein
MSTPGKQQTKEATRPDARMIMGIEYKELRH